VSGGRKRKRYIGPLLPKAEVEEEVSDKDKLKLRLIFSCAFLTRFLSITSHHIIHITSLSLEFLLKTLSNCPALVASTTASAAVPPSSKAK
jgi:hypothetical protein